MGSFIREKTDTQINFNYMNSHLFSERNPILAWNDALGKFQCIIGKAGTSPAQGHVCAFTMNFKSKQSVGVEEVK